VTFSHTDPEMIKRVVAGYTGEGLLGEFLPIPDKLVNTMAGSYGANDPRQAELEQREQENLVEFGHKNWYDWCVANWGTKWDINAENNGEPAVADDGLSVQFSFDSAWSPPIAAYEKMEELGFTVDAFYYEPGMAFCGRYSEGFDDYYELKGTADEVEKVIPEEIDEMFAIVENMSAWESEQEMEQANDTPNSKEEG
jgi:hypothetical protein